MQPDRLETLYAALAGAIDRVGDDRTALLLATLSLHLLAHHADFKGAAEAIERAERLVGR